MKKNDSFNNPFIALKKLNVKKKDDLPAPKRPVKKSPSSDSDLFQQAMEGVTPIAGDSITPPMPDVKSNVNRIHEINKERENDVVRQLQALVDGRARFDISATGEYIEGHAIPIDPQTLAKLKRGDFAVQSHLDLHGMTRDAAHEAVERFIINAHAMGQRSILIIHGRGLTSADGPVLKNALVGWLSRGRLSHLVLAFCSARACDGGTGALNILLKRRPQKSKAWKGT